MDIQVCSRLVGTKKEKWIGLLEKASLVFEDEPDRFVLLFDDSRLAACGARKENVLKYLAVDPDYRGEGLLAPVLTSLREDAAASGFSHQFLYTKPQNRELFQSLFFYPVAETDEVILMESKKDGIRSFLDSLPQKREGERIGCAVMNCNPFTLGHRFLVESAAAECDVFYLFVLSEDASLFSTQDRVEMVRRGTADLENVVVLPTGPYQVSRATFPTYFLKDREGAGRVQCRLDVEIFCRYFAPRFGIRARFVGTEPFSPTTHLYNETMKQILPSRGIDLRILPRLEQESEAISASRFRALYQAGEKEKAFRLVPESTRAYLEEKNL